MARPYQGKLAIVTGASRGIGAGVAKRLAAKGSNVLVTFTSESSKDLAQEIVEELKSKHKVHSQSIQTDLTQATNAATVILEAAKSLFHSYNPQGKFQVDILINNAGVSSNQLLNDPKKGAITEAEFTRVYAVNVLAPLILTQTLAPFLPTDRSGRIVNVSSVSSSIGYLGQSVYAGSKGALEVMTRTWARELSERATVNSVNPGPVWGDMYAEAGPAFWSTNQPFVDVAPLTAYNGEANVLEQVGEDADKFDKLVRGGMGGRRPGFVDEVAGTIDMLCTEESGWTTGSVVCANGGMRMNLA